MASSSSSSSSSHKRGAPPSQPKPAVNPLAKAGEQTPTEAEQTDPPTGGAQTSAPKRQKSRTGASKPHASSSGQGAESADEKKEAVRQQSENDEESIRQDPDDDGINYAIMIGALKTAQSKKIARLQFEKLKLKAEQEKKQHILDALELVQCVWESETAYCASDDRPRGIPAISRAFYALQEGQCMLIGATDADITCAHLLPYCSGPLYCRLVSLAPADINTGPNTLDLHYVLEGLLDKMAVAFRFNADNTIRFCVLDPSISRTKITHCTIRDRHTRKRRTLEVRDCEGDVLSWPNLDHQPFSRVIRLHFIIAAVRMILSYSTFRSDAANAETVVQNLKTQLQEVSKEFFEQHGDHAYACTVVQALLDFVF